MHPSLTPLPPALQRRGAVTETPMFADGRGSDVERSLLARLAPAISVTAGCDGLVVACCPQFLAEAPESAAQRVSQRLYQVIYRKSYVRASRENDDLLIENAPLEMMPLGGICNEVGTA
ncbi:hypothetical protein E2C01_059171 [Portunus trituberculatus]|uniref:Uncharacterized protein n=1 Tax=Portunus trituberculatus TaxID=210409 RepID=A0A5B7H541_PORTR|nr:hypothetical protein [Portunus trituberculatus]